MKQQPCHPRAGGDLVSFLRKIPAFAGMTMLLLAAPAIAEPYTYAPDHCDFTITFPEEPYTLRRCEDGTDECYNLISFTQVYEVKTTVNFRVICNPTDKVLYDQYDEDVMKATVRALTKQSVVDEYQTTFRAEEHYKQASLVGQGRSGKWDTLFIGQLWVGQNSVMSLEAEMIGQPFDAADKLLSEVLKSVRHKNI